MHRHRIQAVILGGFTLMSWNALAANTITLNGTVRDFVSSPGEGSSVGASYVDDFERVIADDRGLVKTTLGADGTPQYAPAGPTATTKNATQFNYWYHDTPGVNKSAPYAITLTDNGAGLYTYSNSSFFPIDNQLFGNGGNSHNYSFTYQVATKFNYSGSGTFGFSGDDDVWVFINKQLAIDLGGVHGEEDKTVDLSTLGLTTGQNYDLDVFFAERHTTGSDFRMQTTLALETRPSTVPDAGSTAALIGGAVAALAVLHRKRAQ